VACGPIVGGYLDRRATKGPLAHDRGPSNALTSPDVRCDLNDRAVTALTGLVLQQRAACRPDDAPVGGPPRHERMAG